MAKKSAKRTPGPKKPKQQEFDGMEKPSIPELDEALEVHQDFMQQRMALLAREVEAKGKVDELMQERELTVYESDFCKAEISEGERKLKIKRLKEKGE